MAGGNRRWNIWIPLATALSIVFLYCLTLPRLLAVQPLDLSGTSPTSSEIIPDENHPGPPVEVPANKDLNDLGLILNPEAHVHRTPRTSRLEWNITRGERRPDGVAKPVFLINDVYPAPAIEARSGDQLIITVNNHVDDIHEQVAIHWHGLHVSNDMDGAAGVTQCSIEPDATFTYIFRIPETQAGTFWYHAHFETQRAEGLYGAIIIHQPADAGSSEATRFDYEEDQVLMLGDWYHRPANKVLASYDSWETFKIEPVPDSMLLNGKGSYNCSMAVPARPVDCEATQVPSIHLKSARTRLRIVNTGASTGLSISLIGFAMSLIKVDGGADVADSSPVEAIGVLYPGERMDIVVERVAIAEGDEPRLILALDRESMQFRNLALTSTQHFPISSSSSSSSAASPAKQNTTSPRQASSKGIKLDLTKISGSQLHPEISFPSPDADETILLYTNIAYLAILENRPKGMINNTYWTPSHNNTHAPLLSSDRKTWPADPKPLFVPAVAQSNWIDIIINNMDDKGHPFHLHGHAFYVLARYKAQRLGAYSAYNPYATPGKLPGDGEIDLQTPVRKDTVYVPSQGFVVLRFKAERGGLWLLHCHVLWHQSVGMGMALQVGTVSPDLKASALESCGGAFDGLR